MRCDTRCDTRATLRPEPSGGDETGWGSGGLCAGSCATLQESCMPRSIARAHAPALLWLLCANGREALSWGVDGRVTTLAALRDADATAAVPQVPSTWRRSTS